MRSRIELRVGARASALAQAQATWVCARLQEVSGITARAIQISSEGDRSTAPLTSFGGRGVFVANLRQALLQGECDLVVHSLKDLPTEPCPGLRLAATPSRSDARDGLCASAAQSLSALPVGSRVGTGSPRRRAQILAQRPDLRVEDIRGNVDSRIARVGKDLEAVILARAGLIRLGLLPRLSETFSLSAWPTAAGQGALGLEVCEPDNSVARQILRLVQGLEHESTRLETTAEREVLAFLGAGCAAPIALSARCVEGRLLLYAAVYCPDGSSSVSVSKAIRVLPTTSPTAVRDLAWVTAQALLERGAKDIAGLGG